MAEIEWTKAYVVRVGNKSFRIYLTKRMDGFYGSCVYYTGDRALKAATEVEGGLTIHLKTFFSNSEDSVFKEVVDWAQSEFGEDIEVQEL